MIKMSKLDEYRGDVDSAGIPRDEQVEAGLMLQDASPTPNSIFDGSWREYGDLDLNQQYYAMDKLARIMPVAFTWGMTNKDDMLRLPESEHEQARNMFEFLGTLSWEVAAMFTRRVSRDHNLSFVHFCGIPGFSDRFATQFVRYLRGSI